VDSVLLGVQFSAAHFLMTSHSISLFPLLCDGPPKVEWDLHLNSVAQMERIHPLNNQPGFALGKKVNSFGPHKASWAGKLELWSLFLCPWEDDMRTGRKEFLVKGNLFFTWFWLLLLLPYVLESLPWKTNHLIIMPHGELVQSWALVLLFDSSRMSVCHIMWDGVGTLQQSCVHNITNKNFFLGFGPWHERFSC